MNNEKTSVKAATLAGRVLQWLKGLKPDDRVTVTKSEVLAKAGRASDNEVEVCTVAELRTIAASCLTQTKDLKAYTLEQLKQMGAKPATAPRKRK